MAEEEKKAAAAPKEEKPKKEKKPKKHVAYKDAERMCSKCGARMGNHADRFACGKCGYTEWKQKK